MNLNEQAEIPIDQQSFSADQQSLPTELGNRQHEVNSWILYAQNLFEEFQRLRARHKDLQARHRSQLSDKDSLLSRKKEENSKLKQKLQTAKLDIRQLERYSIREGGARGSPVARIEFLEDAKRNLEQRCRELGQENAILESKLEIQLAGEEFDITKMPERLDFLIEKFKAAMPPQEEAETAENNKEAQEDWALGIE